jgi:prefoldin subunit 5
MKFSGALLAAVAIALLGATAAEAKQAKLNGQLVAGAVTKGGKVQAPVLLSEKTAKKLKLRSPLATLTTKGSKTIPAPNPAGGGTVEVAPSTLRAGDSLTGKAKLKGSAKKLMPTIKGSKLEITDRESAYSVDELTAAIVDLYRAFGALSLRVDALETTLVSVQQQLEELKQQNAGLAAQIDSILGDIADLEGALAALQTVVGGLPTQAQLQAVIDDVTSLQSSLAALQATVDGLEDADFQGQIDALETDLGTLQTQVNGVAADINFLCGNAGLLVVLGASCPA